MLSRDVEQRLTEIFGGKVLQKVTVDGLNGELLLHFTDGSGLQFQWEEYNENVRLRIRASYLVSEELEF